MCARYTLTVGDAEVVVGDSTVSVRSRRRFNIAPSQEAPIIWLRHGSPAAFPLVWGFLPLWARQRSTLKPVVNARAETAAAKPLFRAAFRSRRCLAPLDGFFEWGDEGGRRQPWRFSRPDGAPFLVAALWEPVDAEGVAGCFLLMTTAANGVVQPLHDRMPALLDAEGALRWLTADPDAAARELKPCPDDWLERRRVSPAVNSPLDDRPELLLPPPPPAPRWVTGELFPG